MQLFPEEGSSMCLKMRSHAFSAKVASNRNRDACKDFPRHIKVRQTSSQCDPLGQKISEMLSDG